LLAIIEARLFSDSELRRLRLRHGEGAAIAWLYANGDVLERRDDDEFAHITVRLEPEQSARFDRMQRRQGN
jgi:GTP-binding protein HflX